MTYCVGGNAGKYLMRFAAAFCAVSLFLCGCQDSLRCTDPNGCITFKPDQPLTIGIERATTGDEGAISQSMIDAVKLASSLQPLFYRHPIQFYIQDTPCTLHEHIFTTGLMVSQPDMIAVIGPVCPESADDYAKIISDAGSPLLSAARALDASNLPGVFSLFPSSQDLAKGLDLLLSNSSMIGNIDLVVWNEAVDNQFSSDFCLHWQKHGYQCKQILSLQPDNLGASDIASQVTGTSSSLLIVLPFTYLNQIPDFHDLVSKQKMVFFDPELSAWNKNQDPYWINRSVVTYRWQPENKSIKLLLSNGLPDIHGLLAYDAYNMLLRSLSESVRVMPGGKISIFRQELRQSFEKIVDYRGLAGTYSCSEQNSCLKIEGFLELEAPDQ